MKKPAQEHINEIEIEPHKYTEYERDMRANELVAINELEDVQDAISRVIERLMKGKA